MSGTRQSRAALGSAMGTCTMNGQRVGTDQQLIRCALEMDSDGHIAVIIDPSCSVRDVHDMLRQLVLSGGHFEHMTFVDQNETEYEPGRC